MDEVEKEGKGKIPGQISSSTYFISEESQIPTISLIAEPGTLWDEEIGIYENEIVSNRNILEMLEKADDILLRYDVEN